MSRVRLHIIAAYDLPSVSTFGSQQPYVICKALPGGRRTAQTEADDDGNGNNPRWDTIIGLRLDAGTKRIGFEVLHEGLAMSTPIGEVAIDVLDEGLQSGIPHRFTLSNGGELELALVVAGGPKAAAVAKAGTAPSQLRRAALENAGDKALVARRSISPKKLQAGGAAPAAEAAELVKPVPKKYSPAEVAAARAANAAADAKDKELLSQKTGDTSKRRVTIVNNAAAQYLSIVVHRAEGLQNVQVFGTQDPYVRASLMPRGLQTVRSTPHASGGTAPVWDDGINDSVDFRLLLRPDDTADSLKIELLNENTMNDDVIGVTDLRFFDPGFAGGYGKKSWYPVDTGGRIELTISFTNPLREANVSVGCRCRRGAHWTHGTFYDGGPGKLGTVLGYRDSRGKRYGTYPARIEKRPCAVVRWDTGKKAFYPIGEKMHEEESACLQEQRYDLEIVESDDDDDESEEEEDDELAVARARERVMKERAAKRDARKQAERDLERDVQEAEQQREQEKRSAIRAEAGALARRQAELEELRRAEAHEKLAAAEAAQVAAAAAADAERASAESSRAVARLSAAIAIQKVGRGSAARTLYNLAALRASTTLGQKLWRGKRSRLALQRRRRLAALTTRAFRGKRLLRLVSKMTSGILFVVPRRARNLRNVQLWLAQDPYVTVTLMPSRRGNRCKCVKKGGTEPTWNRSHQNQIALELKNLATSKVVIEVWNENSFGGDDLIGSVSCDLPYCGRVQAQEQWLSLAQGGELLVEMFVAHSSEVIIHDDEQQRRHGRGSTAPRGPATGRMVGDSGNRKISLLPMIGQFAANSFGIGFMLVKIHSARALTSAQFLMRQDPYVRVTTLPSRATVARTAAIESGDCNCDWTDDDGATMALRLPRGTESLLIEVLNENNPLLADDEVIGVARYELDSNDVRLGRMVELQLESQGTLSLTLSATPGPLQGMYCWQRAAKPSGLGKTLVVELHRAEKLKNLMWFGSMDPICVVRLLPQQSPVATSCVCPDGGTDPEWDEVLDNKLALPLERGQEGSVTSVCVELWNWSFTTASLDEMIGRCEIRFTREGFKFGKRQWFNVSTGGRVRCTLYCDEF